MKIPKIMGISANTEYAEVSGIVTVGPESAARLTEALGREVKVGEQFDLGTLAVYHKSKTKNFLAGLRLAYKKHEFS